MIKRLIFDVDNTLIKWKNEYLNALRETIEEYKLQVDCYQINKLTENYQQYCDKYTKNNLLNLINKELNLDLDMTFIDKWFKRLETMSEYDEDIFNTVKYLSTKYELVILSNWFLDNQIKRLENAKLKDFFIEFVDSSEVIKPNKDSYKVACGNNKIDECIMIGDNYDIDIKVPLEIGMKSFYITNNKMEKKNNLYVIKHIKELKDIL